MTTWAFISGFLGGWIVGVWMSHRKIRRHGTSFKELLEVIQEHRELRERLEREKRDGNVVDFPGNGERKH